MENPHDNILQFHAVMADRDYIYIFMPEYENMQDMSDSNETELLEKADVVIPQVLKAVVHLNQNGIMHRDIKPQNFLVSKDLSQVVLIDFGLATTAPKSTAKGGTIEYIAPEVIEPIDFSPYDAKVDAWAVGILIYKIITGKTPFNYLKLNNKLAITKMIGDRSQKAYFYPEEWGLYGLKWRWIAEELLNKDP